MWKVNNTIKELNPARSVICIFSKEKDLFGPLLTNLSLCSSRQICNHGERLAPVTNTAILLRSLGRPVDLW